MNVDVDSRVRPRRRRRRRWFVGSAVVIVLLGAWWVSSAVTDDDQGHWTRVERDDLVLGIEVTGSLRAVETSLLGPPQIRDYWQFKISHMAPEGDEVEAGTPVLSFDTSELEKQLQLQEAESQQAQKQIERTEKQLRVTRRQDALRLAEAQARLRKARLKIDRPGEMSAANELALARLDAELAQREVEYLEGRLDGSARSAEATLRALRNQQARAERRVEEIRTEIGMMTRTAPRDATVIYTTNWRDEKKQVGDNCWRGESPVELPDLRRMVADGQIDEADTSRLAEGQRVTFRLDAHPDVNFSGTVASIWKTVQRESWRSPLKVVRLEIELEETDQRRMRPGMRLRGKVETDRVGAAVLVPIEGVFLADEGPVVYRKTWLGHETVPVDLGRRDEKRVEVLSGVEPGDLLSLIDLAAKNRRET